MLPFWATALGYVPADPPPGHSSWREYYLSVGVPESELNCDECLDRLVDPAGQRPPIWFQIVPEGKPGEPRTRVTIAQRRRTRLGGSTLLPDPTR